MITRIRNVRRLWERAIRRADDGHSDRELYVGQVVPPCPVCGAPAAYLRYIIYRGHIPHFTAYRCGGCGEEYDQLPDGHVRARRGQEV